MRHCPLGAKVQSTVIHFCWAFVIPFSEFTGEVRRSRGYNVFELKGILFDFRTIQFEITSFAFFSCEIPIQIDSAGSSSCSWNHVSAVQHWPKFSFNNSKTLNKNFVRPSVNWSFPNISVVHSSFYINVVKLYFDSNFEEYGFPRIDILIYILFPFLFHLWNSTFSWTMPFPFLNLWEKVWFSSFFSTL